MFHDVPSFIKTVRHSEVLRGGYTYIHTERKEIA
jgi:hypothetical protein